MPENTKLEAISLPLPESNSIENSINPDTLITLAQDVGKSFSALDKKIVTDPNSSTPTNILTNIVYPLITEKSQGPTTLEEKLSIAESSRLARECSLPYEKDDQFIFNHIKKLKDHQTKYPKILLKMQSHFNRLNSLAQADLDKLYSCVYYSALQLQKQSQTKYGKNILELDPNLKHYQQYQEVKQFQKVLIQQLPPASISPLENKVEKLIN